MFRRQRWARVPRVIPADVGLRHINPEPMDRERQMPFQMLIREHLVAEGVLAIMNREAINGARQMPRGMLFRAQHLLALRAPVPPRPLAMEDDPRAPPRAVVLALEAMDDGNHPMALSFLRAKIQSEAAEQGINHSL